MLTALNFVLIAIALIAPNWIGTIAVIGAFICPDVVPVIDEAISIAFVLRKLLLHAKNAKEAAPVVVDQISSGNVRDAISTVSTNAKEVITDVSTLRGNVSSMNTQLSTITNNRNNLSAINSFDKGTGDN